MCFHPHGFFRLPLFSSAPNPPTSYLTVYKRRLSPGDPLSRTKRNELYSVRTMKLVVPATHGNMRGKRPGRLMPTNNGLLLGYSFRPVDVEWRTEEPSALQLLTYLCYQRTGVVMIIVLGHPSGQLVEAISRGILPCPSHRLKCRAICLMSPCEIRQPSCMSLKGTT